MDTIFMNSENSKTSKSHHVLVLKLTNKIDLRIGEKVNALSNISIYCTWRNIQKAHTIITNLKYLRQHGMMNLNYWMDRILCQIFKIISNTS